RRRRHKRAHASQLGVHTQRRRAHAQRRRCSTKSGIRLRVAYPGDAGTVQALHEALEQQLHALRQTQRPAGLRVTRVRVFDLRKPAQQLQEARVAQRGRLLVATLHALNFCAKQPDMFGSNFAWLLVPMFSSMLMPYEVKATRRDTTPSSSSKS